MRPAEWMNTLLKRCGLEKPDGRPLYQYRLSDEEFTELTSLLKFSAQFGINNITRMLLWDAAFVMYVAEWWRRFYTGQWGWDGVFDSVGINYQELGTGKRNSLVESGLHRWRREVRVVGDKRKFLGTVATEGGLPLNQLQNSGGWLRNVLQPTLRKHLSRGINIAVLIEGYEDSIPPSYRSTELNQILTDIAQTVVTLRKEYDLKYKDEPLVWLDANHPSWRELFPLPMDDEQAKSLLGELIDTASRTRIDDSQRTPFEVERTIIRAETPAPELTAQIEPPTFVFLDAIGFDSGREDFPSLINLEVYEPGGECWPWCRGVVTTYRERRALKLSGKPLRLTGEDAKKELRLRFKHVGECLLDMSIPGGYILDDELPWLFRNIESKWVLQGSASQSVKDSTALIYIPAVCSFSKEGEKTEIFRCGELFGGAILKLSGVMHCHSEDSKYRISAGQEESVVQFFLKGKKCPFPSMPKDIYIGPPELGESNLISGIVTRRHDSRLMAKKIGGNEQWRPLVQCGPGYYEVRLTDAEGNTQLRKRVGILDSEFGVQIKPDRNKVKAGVISLSGAAGLQVATAEPQIKAKIACNGDFQDIQVEANEEPPISIDVSLKPEGQNQIISLTLPYPSKGVLLFDGSGNAVPLSIPLNLSALKGYRLKLFTDGYREGQKLDLEFSLIDAAMDSAAVRDLYIKHHVSLSSEMTEFSINDWYQYIDSLISVGTSIDAMVKINLALRGQKIVDLFISRYERELSTSENHLVGFDLTTLQNIGIEKLAGLKASVMNLAQPEQNFEELEPQSSQGVLIGTWDFKPETRQDGPWIIYPSKDSTVSFRPKLWNVGSIEHDLDVHTLSKAMQVSNPDERAVAITSVMLEMADEPDHRSWAYLANLWKKTKHLPITTFDIWRLSISEPSFLASLFVHDRDGIVERLAQDLPVIWELVRVDDWHKALSRYRASITRKLEDEDLVKELLAKKIADIELLNSSLLSVGKILRERLLGDVCQELVALKTMPIDIFLKPQIKEEHQNLLRRQANSEWPKFLSSYISRQVQILPNQYRSLVNTSHDYQASVTFLPWLIAWRALTKDPEKWPKTPVEFFKIQQLIHFDEDWFSAAFQYLAGWLSQQKMESL